MSELGMKEISKFLLDMDFVYTTMIDLTKLIEAFSWCEKEFEILEWIVIVNKFYFKNKKDLMRFKLVWK